jgi:hypothetical protein
MPWTTVKRDYPSNGWVLSAIAGGLVLVPIEFIVLWYSFALFLPPDANEANSAAIAFLVALAMGGGLLLWPLNAVAILGFGWWWCRRQERVRSHVSTSGDV